MRIAWPAIPLLIIAALLPHRLIAQRPDLRVSPDDPTTHALPAEIQIQSAGQIGTRTLVVWGTTRADGESIVPELRMQMLEGSTLSGEQLRLTSDAARPGRFVQVIAFDTSFAVVWNDYRSNGSGMYLRFMDSVFSLAGCVTQLHADE